MGFQKGELGLVGTAAALVFSRVFGLSIVLPDFRGHYEGLGIDPFWVGVAFGAYGLTMALMQFPNGVLSDRFGRKPLLWSATAFFVGGSLLAAFAWDVPSLIAGRLLQGMGAVASVAVAAVGESIPAERRTMAMALIGIPAGTGFLFGMAAGSILYPALGMTALFLITAAVGLLAALPLLRVRMPERQRDAIAPRPITPPVLALALTGFAGNYALTTTLFFLPEDASRVLWILMTAGLIVMLTMGRVIDRRGWTWQPLSVAALGLGASAMWFVLDGRYGFWLGGGLFFAFHAILAMSLPSQVSRIAGPSGGRGHGIQNVIAYGGTFAAGPVAGALAGHPDAAMAVVVAVGTLAAAALFGTRLRPQPSNGPTAGPETEP